jgi:tetratricopeptide (TPR) repeat protein
VIDNAARDNYTAILPVYIAPDKTEALKSAPQLDRTIEKCSKAIKKHSMYIRGVEYCKPIPATYLLMGKAYFKRQDYADALSIFTYVVNTHSNSKVWSEAQTWKARTYLAMNRLPDAQEMLELARLPISNCKNNKYKLHWEANFADYYLKTKEYEQAVMYLSEILKYKHVKKDFRTRAAFILGQVNQDLEQYADAAKQYEYVLKKTPPYEMEFNAAINLALCSHGSSKQEKYTYDKLRKMLKDERNATYKDQIFYTMAMMDLREEKVGEAIKNLEASVFWSIDNPHQKTLSALTLAELFFNTSQYIESQAYYDTVVNNIPPTYANCAEIKERASILNKLVKNLVVINREDSLQRMAGMSESEREKYIEGLIEQYKIREAERLADEKEKAEMMEISDKRKSSAKTGTAPGTWLFYNPTQVKLGMQEFRKRWGNRKLEDYWAVNDINVMDFFVDTQDDTEDETDESLATDKKQTTQRSSSSDPENPLYYLQDVPFLPEQMAASHEAVANALYNAGMIYYEDLNDAKNSVKLLEKLVQRYPEHKLYPLACFHLYKEYLVLKDTEKSDYYKNLILTQFPNSDYANIINDPDYYKKLEAIREQGNLFYVSVYDAYMKKDYPTVVESANEGLSKYPTPELSPKFALLRAVSLSKLYGNDTLRPLLKDISTNYPITEIDTFATGLLELLKKLEAALPVQQIDTTSQKTVVQDAPLYTYNENAFHLVIIIVSIKDMDIEQLKGKINLFNKDFFRLHKFDQISSFYLDDYDQMITISKFQNKSTAMDYYNLMKVDEKYLDKLNASKAKIYVISDANYNPFYKECKNKGNKGNYEEFFKEYYLK